MMDLSVTPSFSTVTLTLVVVVVVWAMSRLWDCYRRFKKWEAVYDALPGKPEKHWFFGNLLDHPGTFGEEGLSFQESKTIAFPRFFGLWFTRFIFVVIVHHPETVKVILKSSAPKPRKTGTSYVMGIRWLGEGLLIANGQKWSRNRRLLTPAFHFDILLPYVEVVNRTADILIEKLDKLADSWETMDTFEHVGLCSLDIILRTAFSYTSGCQAKGDKDPYVQAVHKLSNLWMDRTLKPQYFIDWFYFNFTSPGREFLRQAKIVHDVADSVIKKRKETLVAENATPLMKGEHKRRLDFLDILLTAKDDEGQGLSDLEIRNEVDTFLFEGHDTTASAISFTLLCLARNPDVQSRVQKEIDAVLADRESQDLEWKDMSKLEFLSICMKESMRMFCTVFFIMRETSEDLTIDGHFIPAGTSVGIDINNLHHNEAVWGKDHMEFKPERFTHENFSKMDPFSYIPFSAGTRNCIGQNFAMMEMKVVLSRMLRRFNFQEEPGHVTKRMMGIVMRSENGIRLKVTKREMTKQNHGFSESKSSKAQ